MTDDTFFTALDDTGTCGWQQGDDQPNDKPVLATHIDQVEFSAGTKGPPRIAVTAALGRKQLTRAEVNECIDHNHDPNIPVQSYRMEFVLEDGRFKPTPASVDTVKMFQTQ